MRDIKHKNLCWILRIFNPANTAHCRKNENFDFLDIPYYIIVVCTKKCNINPKILATLMSAEPIQLAFFRTKQTNLQGG